MAVSIDPDSKILGVLNFIKDASSGVHQNPWDNIRDKVGGLLYNTLVEPQEYQTPVFDTGQTQQFADTHNAMLPERGSKQSMLLPFGYDEQGNIEPAIPSLVRDVGLGAFGLLGEYEKAQTGTGYGSLDDITPQETANSMQGLLEVMTGGSVTSAPKGALRTGFARDNVKKTTGLLNDVDDLGFYSPTERLAANLQPKGTGQQYLGILSKGDGQGSRIQEEMADMGLDTWLQGKGKVSRDEVLDYIGDNRLRYGKEVLKSGNPYPYRTSDDWQDAVMSAERRGDFDEAQRITEAWESSEGFGSAGDTRYQKYSQEGGTNYQEGLLTVPERNKITYNQDNVLPLDATHPAASDPDRFWYFEAPDRGIDKQVFQIPKSRFNSTGEVSRQEAKDYIIRSKQPEMSRTENYSSPHYDQANIGLTTRTQSFNTPDGNSVHLMDELQSDWHQEGKKKGYRIDAEQEKARLKAEQENIIEEANKYTSVGQDAPTRITDAYTANSNRLAQLEVQEIRGVPNAPAKQSWMNQGIKKEINQTIADGRDYFAWTGGKQQIDRYEEAMRQNVDEIIYEVGDDGKYFVDVSKNNSLVYENSGLSIEEVEKIFGKDIAKQIKNNNGEVASKLRPDARTLSGDDLAIGGEGMKSFYDKDVKKRTEKIIKRLDPNAKVEVIELDNGNKVWGVKITDKMRYKVKSEGMPLYSIAPIAGAGLLGAGMMRQEEQQPQQGILN
jgi:hypothetical protein